MAFVINEDGIDTVYLLDIADIEKDVIGNKDPNNGIEKRIKKLQDNMPIGQISGVEYHPK